MKGSNLSGQWLALLGLLFSSAVPAADQGTQHFVTDAAQGGLAEVELAEVAQERGSHEQVKDLAKRIQQDHQQANQQLKSIAGQKNVKLPDEPNTKQKSENQRLSKLEGNEFDQAYVNAMIKDHKADIREFEKQARSGQDPEVKAFAAQTLPKLKEHLAQAQQVQKDLQGKK